MSDTEATYREIPFDDCIEELEALCSNLELELRKAQAYIEKLLFEDFTDRSDRVITQAGAKRYSQLSAHSIHQIFKKE